MLKRHRPQGAQHAYFSKLYFHVGRFGGVVELDLER
jgi:hypothetical protein